MLDVTVEMNEIKMSKRAVCAVPLTIYNFPCKNGKAIIGLPGAARHISLLIKSNFWGVPSNGRVEGRGSPGINSGAEEFIIHCNWRVVPIWHE